MYQLTADLTARNRKIVNPEISVIVEVHSANSVVPTVRVFCL